MQLWCCEENFRSAWWLGLRLQHIANHQNLSVFSFRLSQFVSFGTSRQECHNTVQAANAVLFASCLWLLSPDFPEIKKKKCLRTPSRTCLQFAEKKKSAGRMDLFARTWCADFVWPFGHVSVANSICSMEHEDERPGDSCGSSFMPEADPSVISHVTDTAQSPVFDTAFHAVAKLRFFTNIQICWNMQEWMQCSARYPERCLSCRRFVGNALLHFCSRGWVVDAISTMLNPCDVQCAQSLQQQGHTRLQDCLPAGVKLLNQLIRTSAFRQEKTAGHLLRSCVCVGGGGTLKISDFWAIFCPLSNIGEGCEIGSGCFSALPQTSRIGTTKHWGYRLAAAAPWQHPPTPQPPAGAVIKWLNVTWRNKVFVSFH